MQYSWRLPLSSFPPMTVQDSRHRAVGHCGGSSAVHIDLGSEISLTQAKGTPVSPDLVPIKWTDELNRKWNERSLFDYFSIE